MPARSARSEEAAAPEELQNGKGKNSHSHESRRHPEERAPEPKFWGWLCSLCVQ